MTNTVLHFKNTKNILLKLRLNILQNIHTQILIMLYHMFSIMIKIAEIKRDFPEI